MGLRSASRAGGKQVGTGRFDPLADPLDFLRTEVVHYDYVAGFQLRAQHAVDVGEEDFSGRGGSTVIGANMPPSRIAPSSVSVFQWPPGVASEMRRPPRQRA